jgi:hypothetical protein
MWRRPVVTILVLIIAVIPTLPLRAEQKIVALTLRSASADLKVSATISAFKSACAAMALPAGAQQNQKPITQDQVQGMVRPTSFEHLRLPLQIQK